MPERGGIIIQTHTPPPHTTQQARETATTASPQHQCHVCRSTVPTHSRAPMQTSLLTSPRTHSCQSTPGPCTLTSPICTPVPPPRVHSLRSTPVRWPPARTRTPWYTGTDSTCAHQWHDTWMCVTCAAHCTRATACTQAPLPLSCTRTGGHPHMSTDMDRLHAPTCNPAQYLHALFTTCIWICVAHAYPATICRTCAGR